VLKHILESSYTQLNYTINAKLPSICAKTGKLPFAIQKSLIHIIHRIGLISTFPASVVDLLFVPCAVLVAVLSKAETYRSHTGKISRHFWLWSLPPFGNQGEIAYLTYYKEFGDTALRLTASGVHKIESIIGNGLCGRW